MISSALDDYSSLIAEIQQIVNDLEQKHTANLNCRPGCSGCCVNLSVFRVEFDYIAAQIKKSGQQLSFNKQLSCGFLKDNLCSIYKFRPLICRTHGLPLIYLDDQKNWQVDFCPQNFTVPGSYLFNRENTLNLEQLNLQLYRINQRYCQNNGFNPDQRIELCLLTEPAGEL